MNIKELEKEAKDAMKNKKPDIVKSKDIKEFMKLTSMKIQSLKTTADRLEKLEVR